MRSDNVKILLIHPQTNNYYAPININNRLTKNSVSFGINNTSNTSKPDLKQYEIQDMGEYYCGPVSAAGSIITLAQSGFPKLYESNNPSNLIEELAKYFKTDKNGTTSDNMCKGLEAFIGSKGYKGKINYQGFRPVDLRYKIASLPDSNWIKAEINKHNAVFLNIGVYKKDIKDEKTVYTRNYGHFVTAVGSGYNGISIDTNYLSILDPYDKINGEHYIKVKQIQEGKFIHNADDNEISLTDNAAGFYEISPKFNYFAPNEVGIINGVISLEVSK